MPFLLKYYANLPHKHQFGAVGDFGTLWGSFWITAIHFRSTTDILQLFSPAVQKPRVLKVSHSLFKSWQCHEHLQSPERENVSPVCDYVRTRIQARQAYLFIGNLRKEAEHQAGARSDLPFCFPQVPRRNKIMSERSEKVCTATTYLMAIPANSLLRFGAVNLALLRNAKLFTCHC